jgi:hypothetical protein
MYQVADVLTIFQKLDCDTHSLKTLPWPVYHQVLKLLEYYGLCTSKSTRTQQIQTSYIINIIFTYYVLQYIHTYILYRYLYT